MFMPKTRFNVHAKHCTSCTGVLRQSQHGKFQPDARFSFVSQPTPFENSVITPSLHSAASSPPKWRLSGCTGSVRLALTGVPPEDVHAICARNSWSGFDAGIRAACLTPEPLLWCGRRPAC